MTWQAAYQYLGKLFSNTEQAGQASNHQQGTRRDADLPLGAKIGSVISLQKSPLIRAISVGSLIDPPDEGETRILAISRVQLDMAGELYRYYLNCDEEGTEKFLQLYCDASGNVAELLYCSRLARLIPESDEDQQAFMGENGSGLGDRSYTLWRQQLAQSGMDDARLDNVFFGAESLTYLRDCGDSEAEFIAPFRGSETRIDDASGEHGLQQDIVFMPYSRNLGNGEAMTEQLLISTEILRSKNGDRTQRGIHVDFTIAIPIETERLLVQ